MFVVNVLAKDETERDHTKKNGKTALVVTSNFNSDLVRFEVVDVQNGNE